MLLLHIDVANYMVWLMDYREGYFFLSVRASPSLISLSMKNGKPDESLNSNDIVFTVPRSQSYSTSGSDWYTSNDI